MRKLVLALLLGSFLAAGPVLAGMRTISWSPVTTYTDNTTIEATNLPIRYSVWMIDNVTKVRTTLATDVPATSATFNDAGMVKGRWYIFYGNAKTQDNATSADSGGYDWARPFQFPKHPENHHIP